MPGDRPEQGAFNSWLAHGLQQHYGGVLKEPVPEELLRLLAADS